MSHPGRFHKGFRNLILAAVGFAWLLASCKTFPIQGEQATITFACMDYQRSLYEPLVEGFQKSNPGLHVQLISADEASGQKREGNTVTGTSEDFGRVAAAADTFVWFSGLQPADWTYTLDLQPFVDNEAKFPFDDYYPNTLDQFRWQDDLHGLPAEVHPMLIYYDKKLFDEAGQAYPQSGWTWDDLVETAGALTKREAGEVKQYGFLVPGIYDYDIVLAMMKQHGVSLWDDANPPRPLYDRPEAARVLRRFTDLALVYGVMPVPELENDIADSLINEGKAPMWVGWVSSIVHRSDVRLVPFPEEEAAANPRFMYGFFASAGTAHPQAAWRWLRYLSDHYQPFLDGILPARRSIARRVELGWKLEKTAIEAIDYALEHPAPPQNSLDGPLVRAIFDVSEGKASAEQAMATAQSRVLALQKELAASTPAPPRVVASQQATPAGTQTTITFSPFPGADLTIYRGLAMEFEKIHPELRVEVVSPKDPIAPGAKVSDCFAADIPVRDGQMGAVILRLDPFLEADADLDLADFYPALLSSQQYNHELWGLPYEADALMVYYNQSIFDSAGIQYPAPGWDIDDFLDKAVTLSSGSPGTGFTTRQGAYGDLIFVLERLGADLVDESQLPPAPTFDDPSVIAALAQYAALSRQQSLTPRTPSKLSGWPDSIIWGAHPAGIEAGKIAMWIDYVDNFLASPGLSYQAGIAPLPAHYQAGVTGGQNSTEFSVRAYYISANAANPQACWEWLAFLSRQAEPVGLLPARRSIAASAVWQSRVGSQSLPAYQASLDGQNSAIFSQNPDAPWIVYTYPWLDEAFQSVLAGEDAGQALAKAQQKAEAFVSCLLQAGENAGAEIAGSCARNVDPEYPKY